MIHTQLRIEEELYNAIAKLAQKERRSINAQILYMLQSCIENKKN